MTTEIESLLERVRKATGPDRDLDVEIEVALPSDRSISHNHRPSTAAGKVTCRYNTGSSGTYNAPFFTYSIDAAVSLVKRVLPGWMRASGNCGEEDMPWACVTEPVGPCRDFAADAPTEPLAILTALLLALLHQASDSKENDRG